MQVIYINRAELVGNPETQEKSVLYKGKRYKLTSKDWEEAEKEAKSLLDKLFPQDKIIIS